MLPNVSKTLSNTTAIIKTLTDKSCITKGTTSLVIMWLKLPEMHQSIKNNRANKNKSVVPKLLC